MGTLPISAPRPLYPPLVCLDARAFYPVEALLLLPGYWRVRQRLGSIRASAVTARGLRLFRAADLAKLAG